MAEAEEHTSMRLGAVWKYYSCGSSLTQLQDSVSGDQSDSYSLDAAPSEECELASAHQGVNACWTREASVPCTFASVNCDVDHVMSNVDHHIREVRIGK